MKVDMNVFSKFSIIAIAFGVLIFITISLFKGTENETLPKEGRAFTTTPTVEKLDKAALEEIDSISQGKIDYMHAYNTEAGAADIQYSNDYLDEDEFVTIESIAQADSLCIVGKAYEIYNDYDKENPFETQNHSNVTIVDKQKGYVQYCLTKEMNKKDRILASETCLGFIRLTKNKY